ncbi:MAG: mraZ [Candidatus Synoicihabitans palmerolidicus]|nr:mraZ [Candidatus Synoicihabitans palmerolidicus]
MSTAKKQYLTGKFRHNLDDKNRVTVPSAWRNLFEKGTTFLAIPNPGGYVTVLPPVEANKLYEKFAEVPLSDTEAQDEVSAFMANTQAFSFDSQGRIALMESLFEHANLKGPKEEVVLVGGFNKFNIYSPERWAIAEQKSTPSSQGNVMRRFGI